MENVSLKTLENLYEVQDHCISIFLPTHKSGHETLNDEDKITYKSLIQEAAKKLEENDISSNEAKAVVDQLQKLYEDGEFWRHQGQGLAVFASPHYFNYFTLPIEVEKTAISDKSFYLKPLVRFLSVDDHFLVLSLSRHGVKLYHGNNYNLDRVPLPENMPESMEEALALDEPDTSLQYHTGKNKGGAMFHGHGMGKDLNDKELQQYIVRLEEVLEKVLNNHREPLVLIGLEHITSFYKQQGKYNYIVDEVVQEDPSFLNLDEIHKKTYKVAKKYFKKKIEEASSGFNHLRGTGKTAEGIDEVTRAAIDGQVRVLFLEKNKQVWGKISNDRKIEVHEEPQNNDKELLNEAAIQTILKGGEAYFLERENMPVNEKVACATLRL